MRLTFVTLLLLSSLNSYAQSAYSKFWRSVDFTLKDGSEYQAPAHFMAETGYLQIKQDKKIVNLEAMDIASFTYYDSLRERSRHFESVPFRKESHEWGIRDKNKLRTNEFFEVLTTAGDTKLLKYYHFLRFDPMASNQDFEKTDYAIENHKRFELRYFLLKDGELTQLPLHKKGLLYALGYNQDVQDYIKDNFKKRTESNLVDIVDFYLRPGLEASRGD